MMSEFEKIYRNLIFEQQKKQRRKYKKTLENSVSKEPSFQDIFNKLYDDFLSRFLDDESLNKDEIKEIKNKTRKLVKYTKWLEDNESEEEPQFEKTRYGAYQYLIAKLKDKNLVNELIENCNVGIEEFASYISQPKKKLNIETYLNKVINRQTILNNFNGKLKIFLTANLDKLCDYSAVKKGLGEGKGQLFCQSIFNIEQSNVGDGKIFGTRDIVEVKGDGGRIKDHDRFGIWIDVMKYIENKVHKKPGENFIDFIIFVLKNRNNSDLRICLRDALNLYFRENKKINRLLNKFINFCLSDEATDIGIKHRFLQLCLIYYRKVAGWKYMIIINNAHKRFNEMFVSTSINQIFKYLINNANFIDSAYPTGKDARSSTIQIKFK